MAWEPAEAAAKSADGKYVGLINGQWVPVDSAAKDAGGKYMVLRQTGTALPAEPGPSNPPPPKFTPSGEKDQLNWSSPELIAGQPALRVAKGAASPFVGLFQLAANLAGQGKGVNEHLKQYEDLTNAGQQTMGGGAQGAEVAGSVLSPGFLKAAEVIKPGQRLLTRMLQGTGFGAAGGLTAPVTDGGDHFTQEKVEQTAGGAAGGGLLPPVAAVASKVAGTAYHGLIEPWARPAAIKGRAYLDAAGDKVDEIKRLLTENKQIVAGSAPTAGEAAVPAGRAEFSGLQESAAKIKPSEYLSRADEQNAARVNSLKEWSGNPAKRAEAAAARTARTEPHYQAGEGQTSWSINQLQDAMGDRPSWGAVLGRAERLAEEQKKPFTLTQKDGAMRPVSGEEAQTIKLAFDDMIKAHPKSSMDSAELDALKATRREYIGWMEGEFPELATGRKLYKMTSAPINQMDVGEELVNKLTPALREDAKQRSAVFSGAVRESASTIKKATGEPRFSELSDVLSRRQLQSVHNVQDDLARGDRHLQMAREGAAAGPAADVLASQNLQNQTGGPLPNMLHRGVMLANAIISRMEGKVNRKLASEMASEMLNPPGVAKSLGEAQALQERNKMLAEAIYKWQRPAVAGAANSASTGE